MLLNISHSILEVSIALRKISPQEMLNKALTFSIKKIQLKRKMRLRIKTIGVFRLSVDDLAIDIHGVLILKGRETCEHFIY